MRLMQRVRDSIKNDKFPEFVKNYVRNYYSNSKNNNKNENEKQSDDKEHNKPETTNDYSIPEWVVNSLKSVNINVLD